MRSGNDGDFARHESIRARCFHPSGVFTKFEREEMEQSISDRFEAQALKYPDHLAVKTSQLELTYDALNKYANRVARAILSRRGGVAEPVALLLEHDALMIIAILGALKAGKIYVPLAPSFPLARTTYMLGDSQAGLILTDNRNLSLARELSQDAQQLLNIDEIDTNLSAENIGLSISPDTFAYILYTSGSTGQPKGVIGRHGDILHEIMRVTNDNHICAEDRQTLLTPASVSGSIRDIYGSLLNGAGIILFNIKEEGLANLADRLIQDKATIYRSVTTLFRQFVGTLTGQEKFPALRLIHLGGEPVYRRDVDLYRKYFSQDCILLNGLGLTETGLVRRYFIDKDTQFDSNSVAVGYSIDGMEVLLLDDAGQDVGINRVGEIAVRSRYISPGYWRRPDLTQARFLPDPDGREERIYLTGDLGQISPDGCLTHLGRKDFQVKIRGHRIEVGEIETALLEIDSVKEAVVVARPDKQGDQYLVAYVVPAGETAPSVGELRSALTEKLPEYMIPSAYVMMDAMPMTPTDKIDRRALPAPNKARPDLDTPYVAPRTLEEGVLAGIWADILDLDRVGVDDGFLELGGHSILATQIISRVLSKFRVKMSIGLLLQFPTVAGMAMAIAQELSDRIGLEDVD